MDGDISNLAGQVPLGRSEQPDGPKPSSQTDTKGRRWSPFWAGVFVLSTGLLSWGMIAAVIVGLAD